MEAVKIPPAYMPMPEGCGRGARPVFDGKVCVDTVICEYYCTESCQEYADYDRERILAGKEKRKKSQGTEENTDSKRRDLDLDFETDRIEVRSERKDLEL